MSVAKCWEGDHSLWLVGKSKGIGYQCIVYRTDNMKKAVSLQSKNHEGCMTILCDGVWWVIFVVMGGTSTLEELASYFKKETTFQLHTPQPITKHPKRLSSFPYEDFGIPSAVWCVVCGMATTFL